MQTFLLHQSIMIGRCHQKAIYDNLQQENRNFLSNHDQVISFLLELLWREKNINVINSY